MVADEGKVGSTSPKTFSHFVFNFFAFFFLSFILSGCCLPEGHVARGFFHEEESAKAGELLALSIP